MQGTGHVKERLSLNGPGSARYPDSVVVGNVRPDGDSGEGKCRRSAGGALRIIRGGRCQGYNAGRGEAGAGLR